MSKEHIEREDAKERLRMWITDCVLAGDNDAAACFRDCIDLLDSIPTADVAPVVHGRWIEYPVAHYFKCSNCKYTVPYKKAALLNGKRSYTCCPHCHAVMDLEETKEQKEITSQTYQSDQKRLAEEDPDFLWGWWY